MNLKEAILIPKYRLEELAVLNDERIRDLEAENKRIRAELARHHLTNGCPNTYHNEGCADSHRTVCEYR